MKRKRDGLSGRAGGVARGPGGDFAANMKRMAVRATRPCGYRRLKCCGILAGGAAIVRASRASGVERACVGTIRKAAAGR